MLFQMETMRVIGVTNVNMFLLFTAHVVFVCQHDPADLFLFNHYLSEDRAGLGQARCLSQVCGSPSPPLPSDGPVCGS